QGRPEVGVGHGQRGRGRRRSLVLLLLLALLRRTTALVLAQPQARLDQLAGVAVASGEVEDALGVDVEGDLDLDLTALRRANAGEDEGAEQLVVLDELRLALVDLEHDRALVVL